MNAVLGRTRIFIEIRSDYSSKDIVVTVVCRGGGVLCWLLFSCSCLYTATTVVIMTMIMLMTL